MKSNIIIRMLLILLPLTFSSVAIAQNDFQKIFDEFRKSNEREFQSFRDKANAEYSEFLRQAWDKMEGEKPITKPKTKPITPPVVKQDEIKKPENKEIKYQGEITVPDPSPAPTPIEPIKEVTVPHSRYMTFSIYGTECKVRYNAANRPYLKGSDENSVADFWDILSSSDEAELLIYDFIELRSRLSLCDWAFYKFAEAFSKKVYPDDSNAAVILHAYILTQAGYKLRFGYDKDSKIHMVVATENIVFDHIYWELDGMKYYLFEESDITSMNLCKVDFTSAKPMRLQADKENLFDENLSAARKLCSKSCQDVEVNVSVNLNLISFYNEYPISSSDSDSVVAQWISYANTPLSEKVRETLYSQFRPLLTGKTELAAAEILLNFVQTAFVYKNDTETWGRERPFFAEECLHYPYCDCEDRSILFSHLIRDLLGLDVALIYSPGHLFTAVNFTDDIKGSHLFIGDRKFVICEPTCTAGAPVGHSAVNTDETELKIGLLNKIEYAKDFHIASANPVHCKKSLFPIEKNGKWGYKNADGEIVVACEYDSVSDYEQGDRALYAAKKDSLYTLYYETGDVAYSDFKGYIPLDIQYVEIGGQMTRADYWGIVKNNVDGDDKWIFYDFVGVANEEHLYFDNFEMDEVTYENNIYCSSREKYFTHFIILKRKSDNKYGVLNLNKAGVDNTTSTDLTQIRPEGVVVPFIYDDIKFTEGDKSRVVLYKDGKATETISLENL